MKKVRIVLVISIVLNIMGFFYLVRKAYNHYKNSSSISKINKSERPQPSYYLNRNKLFEMLPKDSNAIVFLGNSLTQNFELAEMFKNLHVKNRGINGDHIVGVLNRLGSIIEMKPEKIFLEIGINDLGNGVSKDRVINNYKILIDTLLASCPQTKLYIQSLFPVSNKSRECPTYCSPSVNADILEVNSFLSRYSKEKGITYIDTHRYFVLNGELNPEYSLDGVHLSEKGYFLWRDILKPYINE